jgi:hypothetical protein
LGHFYGRPCGVSTRRLAGAGKEIVPLECGLPARADSAILRSTDGAISMKAPGPEHPISVEPNTRRVRVTFNDRVVAESARALLMRERNYLPVFYIPREDVDAALLKRTDRSAYCPYKGDASYFSIHAGGRV